MKIGLGIGVTQPQNMPMASVGSPSYLFRDGTQGTWYDPSDINLTWRRNLLTYSEQFDNAVWGKTTNASVTANFDAAPDGSITADRFVSTGGAYPQAAQWLNNLVAGQAYTFSVWVKSDDTQQIAQSILLESGITTFIPTSTWTRVSVTVASSAGGSRSVVIATVSDPAPSSSFYIWGAQLELGSTATPYQRITDGIQDYLTYQPLPILYQDAAGTTPVTGVEQPVGLMLDKSRGLVLGPELVTNGDFSTDTSWTKDVGWTISGGKAVATNIPGGYSIYQSASVTPGKWYKVTFTVSNYVSGGVFASLFSGDNGPTYSANGTYTHYILAENTLGNLGLAASSSGTSLSVDDFSVKELPGNHAGNPSGNSANFPVLSARYNLLTKTEDFSDAAWGKNNLTISPDSAVSPSAASTADTLTRGANTASEATARFTTTQIASTAHTLSVYAKAGSAGALIYLRNLAVDSSTTTGVVTFALDGTNTITAGSTYVGKTSIELVGDGWYRCSITGTTGSTIADNLIDVGCSTSAGLVTGSAGAFVRAWGADLRVTNDALNQPAYQRVNTATDYDTVGFKPYLRFNGTNQWLQTNSIDFTYGDKMFVCAGVRKLSDAATGILLETSNAFDTTSGVISIAAPIGGAYKYGVTVRGTVASAAPTTDSQYASPITNILSGIGNISGDQAILRVNGTQVASSAADQGTGTYGNYPLYIGARGGSSLWFNGRLYDMVVAGKQVPELSIQLTEKYLNDKTAAFDYRDVSDSSSFRWNSATASPDAS